MKFNKKLLSAASVLSILITVPAYADSQAKVMDKAAASSAVVKEKLKDTKENVAKAAEAINDKAGDVVDTVTRTTTFLVADYNEDRFGPYQKLSAIIGTNVVDEKGNDVAIIKDILVDEKGIGKEIILADGEVIGFGKKIAVSIPADIKMNEDGKYIMPVTEKMINDMPKFKYSSDQMNGLYSLAELNSGVLKNADDKDVASVYAITFEKGKADKVVVSYDQKFGFGGEKAVIDFKDLKVSKKQDKRDTNFMVSSAQESELMSFVKDKNTKEKTSQ